MESENSSEKINEIFNNLFGELDNCISIMQKAYEEFQSKINSIKDINKNKLDKIDVEMKWRVFDITEYLTLFNSAREICEREHKEITPEEYEEINKNLDKVLSYTEDEAMDINQRALEKIKELENCNF